MSSPIGALLPDWKSAILPPHKPINGRYCQLQPLAIQHAPALWRAIESAPQLFDYLPYGPFETQADFAHWLADELKREDAISWAICSADGAVLGLCSYLRLDPNNGSIEIGNVLFSPALQRTRIATEAMFLLMSAVFQNGFRRYEWKCNSLNASSKAAAKRLGFSYEGTFRQAAVVKGRNRDTDWFSVTDAEWPLLRESFERWLTPANFDRAGGQIARLTSFV